jgi:type III pantothenate kinase
MLIAINANNTNTKVAIWDGDQLRGDWRIATDVRRTADEYVVWLDHMLGLADLTREAITAAIVASVVPGANFNLLRLCRDYCRSEPLVVGAPGVKLGTKALVDRPSEVGADRLCNTVAAHDRYGGPLVVVDFGTATCFDVVDGDGNFRGGAIAPGINVSIQAFHMATAQLQAINVRRAERVIGTNTVDCMQAGIFWGYLGLIEGLVARIREEFGAPMTVVATGGLAPLFVGQTPVIDRLDETLALWGLRIIYRHNVSA